MRGRGRSLDPPRRLRPIDLFYKGKRMKKTPSPGADLQGFGYDVRGELASRIPHGDIKVLDVGTGFAGNAEFLAKTLSDGSRIWTLDPSAEVLTKARETLEAQGLGRRVEFVKGSIERVDLSGESFDLVISVMALHHMKSLQAALDGMSRVVRGGGKVLLADFSPEAARKLKFGGLHKAADFFSAEAVKSALRGRMRTSRAWDFGLWYIIEATK